MHIAILNFHLKGITKEQFYAACDELAPKLAAVPGLISKVWLADPSSNTYGGVYTFRDRAAFEAFVQGELGSSFRQNPGMTELSIRDYSVLQGPTRVTRGLAAA
jgi:hypothetical protein